MAGDEQHAIDRRKRDSRLLLRVAVIAALVTVVAAASSVALRTNGDALPPFVSGVAVGLAIAAVISLLSFLAASVLWVLVRFLG